MERTFRIYRRTIMTIREIDYNTLIINVNEMINTLEYDLSRSGGKTKLNCDKIYYLYDMKDRYSKILEQKNSKKPTIKKKEVS